MNNYKFLELILEDDDTPTGGVAFQGETLEHFLECDYNNGTTNHKTFVDYYDYLNIEDIDEKLKESGIKTIRETLAKNLIDFYNSFSKVNRCDYGDILYNLEHDQREELRSLRNMKRKASDYMEMIEEIM